jgi:hypothetical protein
MNPKQVLVISAAVLLVFGVWYLYGPPISIGADDDVNVEELLDELMEAAATSDGPIEVKVVYGLSWPAIIFIGMVVFTLAAVLAYLLRS